MDTLENKQTNREKALLTYQVLKLHEYLLHKRDLKL